MLRQEIREIDAGPRAVRSFGLLVGAVFILIAAVVLWRHDWMPGPVELWLGGIGGSLVVLGLLLPRVLKPVYVAWMILAVVLGFVMTRVILTLVFAVIITPLGLLRRVFGQDPMNREGSAGETSNWIKKTYPNDSPERFETLY